MKDLSEYRILNKASLYREFKDRYNYPDMQITSYRRVLYGESTYLGKGRSPYIADMFKFFGKKLNNIRLCDLNENTRKIYEDALQTIKEG